MSSTITKFFASFLAYGVANKKKRFSAIGRFSEGLAPVKGKIQWGYINKGYDVVIPLMYERAFSFKEGLGMVVLNSQYGFIDHTGQIQIPFKYTAAHSFEQECARVCHDGLWGLIDRQGNYILPPTYSQIEQFAEGLALVSLHNKVGFINKKGEVVIPLEYDNGRSFSEGLAVPGDRQPRVQERLLPCGYLTYAFHERRLVRFRTAAGTTTALIGAGTNRFNVERSQALIRILRQRKCGLLPHHRELEQLGIDLVCLKPFIEGSSKTGRRKNPVGRGEGRYVVVARRVGRCEPNRQNQYRERGARRSWARSRGCPSACFARSQSP